MKIKLTQQDKDKSTSYEDNRGCILYQALKRRFPKAKTINVGGSICCVDNKSYEFMTDSNKIIHIYHPPFGEKPQTLPVTIELNRVT